MRKPNIGLIDVALAVGSFVLYTGPILAGAASGHGPTAAIVGLGLLAAAPLALRRRAPVLVLAAVSAVLIVGALSDVRFTLYVSNAGPALVVAVLTVADQLPWRRSLAIAGGAVAAVTASELIAMAIHPGTEQDAVQLVLAIPAWLAGYVVQTRRQYEERLRAEADRRIRAEERLRVSADVHDIVSHTLSMIAVRSGVARVVLDQRPDEARAALGAIETASRTALDELRTVLKSVRDEDSVDAPTLADLPELVERLRADGYDIVLHVGAVSAPPLVEESAYRVVQEALTNVVRHAGHVPTTVDVTCDDDELTVSVVNSAGDPQPPRKGAGFGLVGMRERAALHDGTLVAGPRPDGSFAVVARFPTGASRG
ncbi:sensor histidine kinase [Cryptosporangium phraense]|uniref:histidine kinase n=1 Tax=Cryptosporangium phraense TaxID=2593070 RepID=A0A545AJR4_9ACTN|nr:histidine kinase [Cryptosporangium phraense]TQS40965.1 histidine kinase [Cryptosporangium phraense]